MKARQKKPTRLDELRSLEQKYEAEGNNKDYRNVLFKQQDMMDERKSHALSFLIIGIILVIIGSITLLMSFKYNTQRIREFRPQSFEFIFTCIALACAISSISYAIYGLVSSSHNKRIIRRKLDASKPVASR